jgi:hypothetical protein
VGAVCLAKQIAKATRTALADEAYQRLFIEAGVEPQFDWTPEKNREYRIR